MFETIVENASNRDPKVIALPEKRSIDAMEPKHHTGIEAKKSHSLVTSDSHDRCTTVHKTGDSNNNEPAPIIPDEVISSHFDVKFTPYSDRGP